MKSNSQSFKEVAKICLQLILVGFAVAIIGYLLFGAFELLSSWGSHWLKELMP